MLSTKEEIESWLKEMDIKEYIIARNLTVSVPISVDLSYKGLREIPVQFGTVMGSFSVDRNELISLKGCPRKVGESFFANENQLTSLEYFPKHVGGIINLNHNSLTSLKGMPSVAHEDVGVAHNRLTSLEGIPLMIQGTLNCTGNNLSANYYKNLTIDNDIITDYHEQGRLEQLKEYYRNDGTNTYCLNFNHFKEIMSKIELKNKLNHDLVENSSQQKFKV